MKSLTSFIKEQFEVKANEELTMVESESKETKDSTDDTADDTKADEPKEEAKTITFDLNGIEDGTDVLNSIKSICTSANIKFDTSNLNTGIKIMVTKDKAEELDKIAELVQEFISSIPNEDHEDISDKLTKLSKSLDDLEDLLDGYGIEDQNE